MEKPEETPEKSQVAVGAVVLRADGAVLLVRRGRPPRVGARTIPGGRPLDGEPLERAAAREVLEETALAVRVVRPLGVVRLVGEGYAFDVHEYLCVPIEPEARPFAGDDAVEVRWAAPDELEALGVNPEAIALVRRAREPSDSGI